MKRDVRLEALTIDTNDQGQSDCQIVNIIKSGDGNNTEVKNVDVTDFESNGCGGSSQEG